MRIGQFVKTVSGRVGVVVSNEDDGGVFRGHCCVWFGDVPNTPVVEHLLITDEWEMIETPVGV